MFELFVLTLFLALIIRIIEGTESNNHEDEDLFSDSNRRDVDYGDLGGGVWAVFFSARGQVGVAVGICDVDDGDSELSVLFSQCL